MKLSGRALRLSIFIGEGDIWHHRSLYAEIVHRAHKAGLAGATVIRGIEGFGASSRIHTPHLFRLSSDLPLLIVIIDADRAVSCPASSHATAARACPGWIGAVRRPDDRRPVDEPSSYVTVDRCALW